MKKSMFSTIVFVLLAFSPFRKAMMESYLNDLCMNPRRKHKFI